MSKTKAKDAAPWGTSTRAGWSNSVNTSSSDDHSGRKNAFDDGVMITTAITNKKPEVAAILKPHADVTELPAVELRQRFPMTPYTRR